MSIKPRFSEAILDGRKHFELRRVPVRVQPGDLVIIYASSPQKAVVGAFVVARVLTGSVAALWDELSAQLGATRDEYEEYFRGCEAAHAIAIGARARIEPVALTSLRQRRPGFRPPQSYTYLRESPAALLGETGAASLARIGGATCM
jgi:predicted transcriptional regulator